MRVSHAGVALASLLSVVGTGCRTYTTASGIYQPPLPPDGLYTEPLSPITDGTAFVAPIGIRLSTGNELFVDVLVWSSDEEAATLAAAEVESYAIAGTSELLTIRDAQGAPVEIIGWRTAMHRRHRDLLHFSVHGRDASRRLPDHAGVARFVVTFTMESNPTLTPGTAMCALSSATLLEYHHLHAEWTPETHAFDLQPQARAVSIPVRSQSALESPA